jgi:hypothetical protein
MKKIVKLSIVFFLFCIAAAVYGQTPPNSVTIDGKEYFQHGRNQHGNTPDINAAEAVDSVTVTARMRYFVLPDATVSPEYFNEGAPISFTDFSKVNSSFVWEVESTTAGIGVIEAIGAGNAVTDPLIFVRWTATGEAELKVEEAPGEGEGACSAGEPTIINVEVIAKPTIEFANIDDKYYFWWCDSNLPYSLVLDMVATSAVVGNVQMQVKYTVSKNDGTAGAEQTATIENGKLSINFDDYGVYVITITEVTDRISRKSGVLGDVGIVNDANVFTFEFQRPIETGPIFRIPNDFE